MCNILDFQTSKELSIVQFSTKHKNTFDYISLSSALERNFLIIKEIDEDGDVNHLIATNNSDKYIFMMDGDILEGAKQNRVLNTSILLAPGSKTVLPVSCIEKGRWSYVSKKFKDTEYVIPTKLRQKKASSVKENLKIIQGFSANQTEVWNDVEKYERHYQYHSSTSNLSDVYKNNAINFDKFIKLFQPVPEANGIAFFIRRNLLSIDVFNKDKIYIEYFSKLLKSVAFEVYHLKPRQNKILSQEAYNKVLNFFAKLNQIEKNEYDGVGVGTEERFESEEYSGFSLKYKQHLIHLAGLHL